MEEIISGHTETGQRAVQSAQAGVGKDLFPSNMSEDQIERTIRQAYRTGEKIKTHGDRVLVRGTANGMTKDMWVNKSTKVIETAYPK